MKLMAAGAAAVLARPLETLAAPARKEAVSPATSRPLSAAMRREVASQKKSIADMLKVIRAYDLPAGSPPAFIFRAERRKGTRGR